MSLNPTQDSDAFARTFEGSARTFEASARTFEASAGTFEASGRSVEGFAKNVEAFGGTFEGLPASPAMPKPLVYRRYARPASPLIRPARHFV
jgi:hypothetical protein